MEFRLLGPLEVESAGRGITPTRPQERAVLALLLLKAGLVVTADQLIDGVWGEDPPPTARTALQGVISALRRRIGADRIETRPAGYRLALMPEDGYDVATFEHLVAAASDEGAAKRSELQGTALALVRGEPLADVLLSGPIHEVVRLGELVIGTEEARIETLLELGQHRELIPRLEQLVAEHPLREGLRGQLMHALYRSGRQADALRVAQEARRVLALELGVEPGPALQDLERRILDHDPGLGPSGTETSRRDADAAAGDFATCLAVHEPTADARLGELLALAAARHGGVELPSGRGRLLGFARARDAAVAAAALQRDARRTGEGLRIGLAVARGARHVATSAHPGQVVLTREIRDLLREAPLHEVDVRELGPHRLTDLGPHQLLYQLMARGLDVDFPPLRSLENLPTNLPIQATALIGRDELVADVVDLVSDPANRLVTLIGPGGTGKTRLAVHAAAELLDEARDGVWFVALDAIADAGLVGATIANAAGIREGEDASSETLGRALAGRRVLLVLDNFEHLLPAAEMVEKLLRDTTHLKVLVTSRVPMKVGDERVVSVPALPAPEATGPTSVDQLAGLASVELFIARARAIRPDFTLTPENAGTIAGLCRALDGLPLAIELAASQVGIVPPARVLERIDRGIRRLSGSRGPGPDRHRALQTAIDWSVELLDGDGRDLLADVAVFAGGWTLDAAEAVCAGREDVLGGLAALLDQSLVRVGGTEEEPRFSMLETIRQYASDRLDRSGRRLDVERNHVAYYQGLADAAEPHLRGNPGEWVARLGRDHDNLRAALDRSAAAGEGAAEARLAGSLWRFWYLAGHLAEGFTRLEHARAVHLEPSPERARVLIGAAVMAVNTRRPVVAKARAEEAIELCRELADAWGVAYAELLLGAALGALGDDLGARAAEEASLSAFRTLGDEHSALLVSRNLAATLEALGDRRGADALHQENLRRARAEGNGRLEASSLGALASIAYDAGRIADATVMLRESLRIHRELGDHLDTAVDLSRAAQVLALSGRTEAAARLVGALDALRDELGARGQRVGAGVDTARAVLQRQLGKGELSRAIAGGEALPLEEALQLAVDALA